MTGDPALFVKGLAFGLALAAPVGPIGLLCIRRTLVSGPAAGIAGGLGAATADAAYGLLAGGGLAVLSAWLIAARTPIQVAGGLLLLWMAWAAWAESRRARPEAGVAPMPAGLGSAFLGTLLLTLANPMTILTFTALFGAMALPADGEGVAVLPLVAGVFLGSAAWWVLLCSGVALAGRHVGPGTMRLVDRGSALLIGGFGLHALVTAAMAAGAGAGVAP
ncbi:MAG TPA: LysE family transporter [Azospirillaceae bacterium]|nr:LysE family transporter [Azospirillaceae bacterium]